MVSEFAKDIKDLRDKLIKLEDDYSENFNLAEIRVFKTNSVKDKISKLKTLQRENLLSITTSGKTHIIRTSIITNSSYDNILKDYLKNENSSKSELFLDYNDKYVETAIKILKKSDPDYLKPLEKNLGFYEAGKEHKFESLYVKNIIDINKLPGKAAFINFLRFFFKKDYEQVICDFDINYEIEIERGMDLTYLIKDVKVKNPFVTYDALYMFTAEHVEEIKDLDNRKAYFMQHQNSDLVLELSKKVKIASIIVKPFTELPDCWYPENKPKIFTSDNGTKWDVIPGTDKVADEYEMFTNEPLVLEFQPRTVKYIKLEPKESLFSVSYINISS